MKGRFPTLPQDLTEDPLKRRIDAREPIQLLDVREAPEFATARLTGAQLAPHRPAHVSPVCRSRNTKRLHGHWNDKCVFWLAARCWRAPADLVFHTNGH